MIRIRPATIDDLDFLVAADLQVDYGGPLPEDERAAHREKIAAFARGGADAGWLAEDEQNGAKAGMILVRFRDRAHEPPTEANQFLFRFLDASIFPSDGRFCEIFQLWVAPEYRRQGLATRLKQTIEAAARQRGLEMIYTHTAASSTHVIELNRKLGYQPVRCGPLWDEVPRTSLVKWLKSTPAPDRS